MVVEGEALVFGLQRDSELKRSHGWTGFFIAVLEVVSSGMSNQPWSRVHGVGLITGYCLWKMTLGAERQSGVAADALGLGWCDG